MDNLKNKTQKKLETAYVDLQIPKSLENLALPDPMLLTFYKNLENRVLWIDDEISEMSLEYAKYIMEWNREDKEIDVKDRKPITICFFSPGGSLDVNNTLIDAISLSTTEVIGVNCGEAASAGCFIYLACHKRYSFPRAKFLIHKGSGGFSGSYDIVVSAIMNYQREIEELGKYVLSRTNIPEEEFYKNFDTDWYLSASEALEYGVCEKIIENLDEIL